MDLKTIRYRDLITAFAVSWICWTLLQTAVLYYSAGFSFLLALQDAVVTNILLALSSYAMINIMRFYQPRQILRIVYSAGVAVISMLIMQWLAGMLIESRGPYADFVAQTLPVRIMIAWLIISLFTASAWLWFSFRDQQELEERRNANEKLAREAELSRLRQQLQPHFLFNSLNSISALIGTKPDAARKMIQQLSDFLRGTLKKDELASATLAEELDHLQLYLEIEKVRFGHRLRTVIERDDTCSLMKIPSLLLQPVVENAIKFGLYDTIGEITIRIAARRQDQDLVITVENPFDPATSVQKGTGFGLSSVHRRLYLLFGRQDLLNTEQKENIFVTTIKIPQAA